MGFLDRFRSNDGDEKCKHERMDKWPTDDDTEIWAEIDSYLEGEPYWATEDACFNKMRHKVLEFKCRGCGKEKTIQTAEVVDRVWKEDLTESARQTLHQKSTCGAWYNGTRWWERNMREIEDED